MKVLPVLTASAIGGVMIAVGVTPAYATAVEPVIQVRSAVGFESASIAEPEESGNVEDVIVEVGSSDEAEVAESGTPAPEIEVQPQTTENDVPAEPDVATSETPATQAAETPIIEPIEVVSAIPSEESLAEVAEAPADVAQAATPVDQPPATQSTLPSVQQSPIASVLPPVEDALPEGTGSSTSGSQLGGEAPFGEAGVVRAAGEEDQDTPREPRPIETLNPAEINDESSPSEAAPEKNPAERIPSESEPTKDTASEQARDREVEAAETPAERPLPQTGSPAAAVALGGAVLLVAGVILASWRRRTDS